MRHMFLYAVFESCQKVYLTIYYIIIIKCYNVIMHHTRKYKAGEGLSSACLNAEHAQ